MGKLLGTLCIAVVGQVAHIAHRVGRPLAAVQLEALRHEPQAVPVLRDERRVVDLSEVSTEQLVIKVSLHELSLQVGHCFDRTHAHGQVLQVVNVSVKSGDGDGVLASCVHLIVDGLLGADLIFDYLLILVKACVRIRVYLRCRHMEMMETM